MNTAPTPAASMLDAESSQIEKRVLVGSTILGVILAAIAGGCLLWLAFQQSPSFPPLVASIGALFSGGKEASLPLAIGYGVDSRLAGVMIGVVDTAVVAILFPLLVRGLAHVESKRRFLGHLLRIAQRHARRHLPWVHRWGPWGLFFFMLVPFAFNGPPQAIVLGVLAGLRPSQVAKAVLSAIVVTTIAWTLIGHYAREALSHINPKLPLYIAIAITVTVIAVAVIGVLRDRRDGKDERPHSSDK